MPIELLFKGILIGFSIAMPVGPIGLLCIRNVLTMGILCGLVAGLGAAVADSIYGTLAALGISAIGSFIESHHLLLQIFGGFFLCYLGISTFLIKTSPKDCKETDQSLSRTFLITFLLTLTNPMTIISFVGVYAALGITHGSSGITEYLSTTLGVFLGSAAWWVVLCLITSFCKEKLNIKRSTWLNKLSGSILVGFGALALIS